MTVCHALAVSALAVASISLASAQELRTPTEGTYQSTIPPEQRRAFFGDLHHHTALSFDAWTFGTKILPDEAYKFGRGETVMVPAEQVARQQGLATKSDVPARRAWPLDFMAVTDHAEWMGVLAVLDDRSSAFAKTDIGATILADPLYAMRLVQGSQRSATGLPHELRDSNVVQHAWDITTKAANDNYEPGKFTTFIGYEWTSAPDGRNLHRNVIFNCDHAPIPFTSVNSKKPEDLWSYLEKIRAAGCGAIAIPHNGNVSGGLMYDWNDSDGRPIDEQYAQRRALNEPLTEIVQNKGQSDTSAELSPSDEFANFEIFDHLLTRPNVKSNPNGSYIRQALGRGLIIQQRVGTNPFKYGLVGGSDIHNGLSASSEEAMASGPFGIDPKTMLPHGEAAKRALGIVKTQALLDIDAAVNHTSPAIENTLEFGSAGVTGVWAEENTRGSIFAALKRRETFATSGTRIRVRMFAGWSLEARMLESGDWVAKAYAQGVPMGGDLPARPASASAPRFILEAIKDPDGANLDRIQVIKLWIDNGKYKEKLFDVALSNYRSDDPRTGRAPFVGNTVNLRTGSYKNTIGATVLRTLWTDPEFDVTKPAIYYARTLEIPTPRWSTLLAIKNALPIPKSVPATIQERAWTSPIWYTPSKT
jgi:hypothetical protein